MKRLVSRMLFGCLLCDMSMAAPLNLSQVPLFLSSASAPLTMLVISRDHKLYFPAYNNASDIDGDGQIDTRFKPSIDYYGYFDSYKCYTYASGIFAPSSVTTTKKCTAKWSGNFLNYLTTSRMDALRKVLYGGMRSTDTNLTTVLERANIPQDGHSWGMDYQSTAIDGYNISDYTPLAQPTAGTAHLFANTTLLSTTLPLLRIAQNQPYRIWDWLGIEKPVAGSRVQQGTSGPTITGITDYTVRVTVCDSTIGLESNCSLYPSGKYKPTGILQTYGENGSMYFGLITGSYASNLEGGVLRKNMGTITDEINPSDGTFTTVNGIISTLNKLTTIKFGNTPAAYSYSCGFISTRGIVNGECSMWGNPVAEMMYEAVRYFAGKATPTAAFNYSTGDDVTLGLPKATWVNPYATLPICAKANILVISDTSPTYDSNALPGSYFGGLTSDLSPAMDVSSIAQTIFTQEWSTNILALIGQSGTDSNGAPTAKTVNTFGTLRGLGMESNSQGSFYAAAVAHYAWMNDLNPASGVQNAKTYVTALSSPEPKFTFNVGGKNITVVPFAKSVGYTGAVVVYSEPDKFQAVNRIVSLFIESLTPTGAVFRVSYDDSQEGADYDMDAFIKYTITVNDNNTLTITVDSLKALGGIIQHSGYTISGTTKDGLYLDVRDTDTSTTRDKNYYLDTPPGQYPGTAVWQTGVALPLTSTRTFTPSTTNAAITLNSPLWYAAKWGGFNDLNNTGKPDTVDTWDADQDGTPDNYFSVTNPSLLGTQLNSAIKQILDRSGSFSSTALSSGYLSAGTRVYQALFQTKDWSGKLLAFGLNTTTGNILVNGGGPQGSLWEAGALLNTKNYNTGRQIITYKPSNKTGIKFRWPANSASPTSTELDAIQVTNLNTNPVTGTADTNGSTRLDYLRGNHALEVNNGGSYRDRNNVLGDIIDSNPISISISEQEYPTSWPSGSAENSVPYSTFKATNRTRQNVVYVGSNDGMLHAFDGSTGVELLAYVPAAVYKNLPMLTNPNYAHQYYVDGSPTVVDAFYSGAWHSVLVGGLGGGGQGIYALDVTKPSQFSEANAANIVEWEFTDANDKDLGYTYSQPQVVRLNTGQWAAIFGNGYNNTVSDTNTSTTGNAVVYVVDIATGTLIKKFDTLVGTSADPLGTARPNGMSTVAVVDTNNDYIADTIYAGDLFGNLWKIDISSTSAASWNFTRIVSGVPAPFFVAMDSGNKRQPITTQPIISRVTGNASAFQIYFGTGKFLENSDKTDVTVQTVYSLIDTGLTSIAGRSVLQQQTILSETSSTRITSSNPLIGTAKGWYMDLIYNGVAKGERSVTNMTYVNKKLIFSTVVPNTDPCAYGGDSWLMELNAADGNSLNYNVLDVNGDGVIDNQDMGSYVSGSQTITKVVSGLKSTVGLIAAPTILNAGTKEYKYMRGTSGAVQKVVENPGEQIYNRQSWKQLR